MIGEEPKFPVDRFARAQSWKPRGNGPNGRKLCYSGCGRELPKHKRTRCSQACYEAWAIRSDAQFIRHCVFERDKGVCALCGVDSVQLQKTILDYCSLWRWLGRREGEDRFRRGELIGYDGKPAQCWGDAYYFAQSYVKEQMKKNGWTHADHSWEADHVIPVVEGGGGCNLDGYRTLCLPCHKGETKRLAGRRAAARKAAKANDHIQLQLA